MGGEYQHSDMKKNVYIEEFRNCLVLFYFIVMRYLLSIQMAFVRNTHTHKHTLTSHTKTYVLGKNAEKEEEKQKQQTKPKKRRKKRQK